MLTHVLNSYSVTNIFKSTFISLPSPHNLSFMWNMGSLLSAALFIQLITGLVLSMSYSANMDSSFIQVFKLMDLQSMGWMLRNIHMNGASLMFFFLYLHISRGLYYGSYVLKDTWNSGVTMFIMSMATAFMGYTLPVNQMSYWGACVITNLFSEFPFVGEDIVLLLWGDISVHNPTIMRFFTLHFMMPFMIIVMLVFHISLLHSSGSSNPLGLSSNNNVIMFQPYFLMKDLLGLFFVIFLFIVLLSYKPIVLGDNESFNEAVLSMTPLHIQPEWYFLFSYSILRSIPNKLGGIIALIMSIFILYSKPLTILGSMKSNIFYPVSKFMFWLFLMNVLLLTWIGMSPVEEPFIVVGQFLTFSYFMYYILDPFSKTINL